MLPMAVSEKLSTALANRGPGGLFLERPYDPKVALDILEEIAKGVTLTEVCKRPDMPCLTTFHKWVVLHADLARAYHEARRLSAQALEDEAIGLGRLIAAEPGAPQRVRAFDVLMNQLRWSAAKRDPSRFGERAPVNVQVPIQINTGLNLGANPAGEADAHNIYTITATVMDEPVAEVTVPAKRSLWRKKPTKGGSDAGK